MSRIRIRNFGPIRDGLIENGGWIDIKKATIFIGDQGSGKSTVAKLISTFLWIEKALTKGQYEVKEFTNHNRFRKNYCAYHKIENYFTGTDKIDRAEIEFEGDSFSMNYFHGKLEIEEKKENGYLLPQIMYVPAERNILSTIKKTKWLNLFPGTLMDFLTEFDNAKNALKGGLELPINDALLEYDKLNDLLNVKGKDYKIRLAETSSGFQSVVPLFLVSRYLAQRISNQGNVSDISMSAYEIQNFRRESAAIINNPGLSETQKREALSLLGAKFNKSAFINIVEEPEQNLFPGSQRKILNSLLEFANLKPGNKLIMTTHSPYIIMYLSLAIQGGYLRNKLINSIHYSKVKLELNAIAPLKSLISGDDVVVYQLMEGSGTIHVLESFDGIPSNRNALNKSLAEGNELFDALFEIEQSI